MTELDNYENRVVAYIDILGFGDLMRELEDDFDSFTRVLATFKAIDNRKLESYRTNEDVKREITSFSDCIVLSYPLIRGAVFSLVFDLTFFYQELLKLGYVLRGGVTIGKLYHTKGRVFGQGLVDAYHLESDIAHYPRIILMDKVVEYGLLNTSKHNNRDSERGLLSATIQRDFDGYLYLDHLTTLMMFPEERVKAQEHFYPIREMLIQKLKKYEKNTRVLPKWHWFAQYFNNVISKEKLDVTRIPLERIGLLSHFESD